MGHFYYTIPERENRNGAPLSSLFVILAKKDIC